MHLFIVNPKAEKGKTLKILPRIKEHFKEAGNTCIIEITKYPGHATEIASHYTSLGNYRIYAVGGDGTLNEVLNGMAGSGSSLGVIPCGSGNDFIKSLHKLDKDIDILGETINGEVQLLDIGRVQDRYFLNIASAGIDAEVANNVRRFKRMPILPGAFAYLMSVIFTILKYKAGNLEISIDNRVFKMNAALLAVANGKFYGGGFMVAPEADLTDGTFDICAVSRISRLRMLVLFPKLLKGTHDEISEVSFFRGKSIKINSSRDMVINVDGELIKNSSINFEIIEKGIKFIVPFQRGR